MDRLSSAGAQDGALKGGRSMPQGPSVGFSLARYHLVFFYSHPHGGFAGGTMVKNPLDKAGDSRNMGLILGLGRYPGIGNGNSLQYSCLKNSMN